MPKPKQERSDYYRQAALQGILSNSVMIITIDKNRETGDSLETAIIKKAIELGDSMEDQA